MNTDAGASRDTAAVVLDGTTMRDESGFHRNLAAALGDRLRADYGKNLDALKDVVSLEIEGPLDIHWSDHATARENLPLPSTPKSSRSSKSGKRMTLATGIPRYA